ncbi:MAG: hypothetical protein KIT62_13655 [Cyclobacteriaceae bacterium]|nr:hypothetical protein [Cyclobacteriaceae bacterium]
MEEFKAIELQQARDFSKKMNVTFEFLRQNFKALIRAILYIAGPPVLVGSLLIGSFMSDFFSLTLASQTSGNPEAAANYFLSVNFWLQLILMIILLFASYIITLACINSYIILYKEKLTNKIEVKEVWNRVRQLFGPYLGTTILFFLAFILVYIFLLIPVFIFGSLSSVLVAFVGIPVVICGLAYLAISSSLTFFIQAYERKNFFDSLARSFRLVNNGKWWSTFGLILILQLITGTVSYIFLIPYYVIVFTASLHTAQTGSPFEFSETMSIIILVCFTLYYMAQMLLYSLPNTGIAFQYFNLVELKEARGLMSQIETLGQNDSAPRPEEHF